jgi:hypothetical protein
VPKGIMVVQSSPSAAIATSPGSPGTPACLAIYDMEADDLAIPVAEFRDRSASGQHTRSDALSLDPPPVVTVYKLLD